MKRREFITLLGGAAAAWPLAARAQQAGQGLPDRFSVGQSRRISGCHRSFPPRASRPRLRGGSQHRHRVSVGGGQAGTDARTWRRNSSGSRSMSSLPRVPSTPAAAKRATSTIPIIFMSHADPLGSGHVASLARPGGNITGLSLMMTETNVKGLELLKEAVPGLSRVAVIFDPATPSHGPGLKAVEAAGPRWGFGFNRCPCAARRSTTAPLRPSSGNAPTRSWSFRPRCSSPGQSGSRNSAWRTSCLRCLDREHHVQAGGPHELLA